MPGTHPAFPPRPQGRQPQRQRSPGGPEGPSRRCSAAGSNLGLGSNPACVPSLTRDLEQVLTSSHQQRGGTVTPVPCGQPPAVVRARRQGPGPAVQLLRPAWAPVLRPRSPRRSGLRLRLGGRCWQRGPRGSAFSGSQFPVRSCTSSLYPSCERDVKIPSCRRGLASSLQTPGPASRLLELLSGAHPLLLVLSS